MGGEELQDGSLLVGLAVEQGIAQRLEIEAAGGTQTLSEESMGVLERASGEQESRQRAESAVVAKTREQQQHFAPPGFSVVTDLLERLGMCCQVPGGEVLLQTHVREAVVARTEARQEGGVLHQPVEDSA